MARHFLTTLAALSLLLCAATVAAWVRSHSVADCVVYQVRSPDGLRRRAWTAVCNRGVLYVGLTRRQFPEAEFAARYDRVIRSKFPDGLTLTHTPSQAGLLLGDDRAFTFTADQGTPDPYGTASSSSLYLSLWPVACLTTLLPALWVRSRRNRLRRRTGNFCPTCDYDLTGNISGTCPECGSPATTSALSKA